MNVLEITAHELQGVSSSGELCSCGITSDSWLEHLGEIATDLVGATRSTAPSRAVDAARTRRVLAQLAAEQDALGEALEATGLTGFVERSEWLIAHRPADRALAWERRWSPIPDARPMARLKPRRTFTEAQLRIAIADYERRRKTA